MSQSQDKHNYNCSFRIMARCDELLIGLSMATCLATLSLLNKLLKANRVLTDPLKDNDNLL